MRRFEYVAGGSSKFWEIVVAGRSLETRWGRIGTEGQSKTAKLASDVAARDTAAKLVREKVAKGYIETKAAKAAKPAAPKKAPTPPTPPKPTKPTKPPAGAAKPPTIAALTKIVAPPKSPADGANDAQWSKLEKKLGTALPPDYKALVAAYGTGKLDGFIWLANPFSTLMPWSPWFEKTLRALREVRASGGKKAVPHAVFPEPEGLLPWASTENGNVFYFRTVGPPASWPVLVIESRGPRFDVVPGNAVGALVALLSKKHRSPVLPEHFPPKKHSFSPFVDEHKTSIELALDKKRSFSDRLLLLRKHAGKAKVSALTGSGRLEVTGTSITIEYSDCDMEDDGRIGAQIFACYAACDEAEVRRFVREAVKEGGWRVERIIDFATKEERWAGRP